MAGRIMTMQRQARELGRLRTGLTDYSGRKPRPVKSKTWIVTSHSGEYVQAAADVWGGKPEAWKPMGKGAEQFRVVTEAVSIDAILPPGDPLSQAYELWNAGGAVRRCDGMTDSLSDAPCLCRQQFGDEFWTNPQAGKDAVCKPTTRLNVIVPDLPDMGVWRMETHSYYAANEVTAAVDVLKGSLGDRAMVPVRLRIEQRTRVARGQTKHFPVVALELRGGTAGQVLKGATPSVTPVAAADRGVEAREAAPELAAGSSEPLVDDEDLAELNGLATQLGLSSTEDGSKYLTKVTGRPVRWVRELTKSEGERVMAALRKDIAAAPGGAE
jgi:hypothetical protein